jgi:diguanylate cyclase (GGDEF)-like protein
LRPERSRALAYAAATGLTYALLSQAVTGLTALGDSSSATFWPGAGLTLGVLLARPRREWPLHLAAVFVAEMLMDVKLGYGWALGVWWAATNTLEPFIGAALLTWGGRRTPDVGLRRDLLRFIIFGVVVGPAVGALAGTLGGVVLAGGGWWPRLPQWFVGDAVGALVVAPAALLVASGGWRWPSPREIGAIALLLAGTLLAVGPWEFSGEVGLPFLVAPAMIAFVAWTGPSGAAVGVLALSAMVIGVTATDHGPFVRADTFDGIVVAQMFLVMAALSSLTTAALLRELVSRAELEQRLRAKALTDNLTGLANRQLLFDRIDRASQRLSRTPGRLALLFIDLDRFKALNDTLGHVSGDEVLIQVGRRLRAVVRGHDTVARLGGDEFLILAEELEAVEHAEALAERVIRTLSEPFSCPGGVARIDASVGYAVIDEPIDAAETLVAAADRAMYAAKRQGGGRAIAALG